MNDSDKRWKQWRVVVKQEKPDQRNFDCCIYIKFMCLNGAVSMIQKRVPTTNFCLLNFFLFGSGFTCIPVYNTVFDIKLYYILQHEASAKRAEMDAYAQQQRAQNIEREGEEARKTLESQTQHERHRAEYQDELERKRQVDMLNAQKYMQEYVKKKRENLYFVQNPTLLVHVEIHVEIISLLD